MRYKPLALAAAALMAGFLSFGSAEAANVMTGPMPGATTAPNANVQLVWDKGFSGNRRYWRGGGGHHWRGGHRWRGGGRHWRHRGWGGSGVFLGLGLAPFYNGYYDDPYDYGYYDAPTYYVPRGSRHVRWCYSRYRSYDARSNTFMGYDGYRHRCRSPYRY